MSGYSMHLYSGKDRSIYTCGSTLMSLVKLGGELMSGSHDLKKVGILSNSNRRVVCVMEPNKVEYRVEDAELERCVIHSCSILVERLSGRVEGEVISLELSGEYDYAIYSGSRRVYKGGKDDFNKIGFILDMLCYDLCRLFPKKVYRLVMPNDIQLVRSCHTIYGLDMRKKEGYLEAFLQW